jgi:hypothetical protein
MLNRHGVSCCLPVKPVVRFAGVCCVLFRGGASCVRIVYKEMGCICGHPDLCLMPCSAYIQLPQAGWSWCSPQCQRRCDACH